MWSDAPAPSSVVGQDAVGEILRPQKAQAWDDQALVLAMMEK